MTLSFDYLVELDLNFQVIIHILAGWILLLTATWLLPYSTILDLQVIGRVADLASIVILILGFIFCRTWEYVRYEAYASFLEGTSILCRIFNASGRVETVSYASEKFHLKLIVMLNIWLPFAKYLI
jgi:hypothetical protein